MWPVWFKLLEQFRRDGRFGLTFPFLLGALRTPPGLTIAADELNRGELTTLLESMRDNTPPSHYVRIALCDWLHEPVAAALRGPHPPTIGLPITSRDVSTPTPLS